MRFRINRTAFITFACFYLLTLYAVFREYCTLSNVRTDVSPTTASVGNTLVVDGWVLDCITWRRKRQSSNREDAIVQGSCYYQ